MPYQSQIKYQRFMAKAEDLFWKYGYNGVSIDCIASESGISKMTIYKHFPSKEELFLEVLINNTKYHINKIMEIINEKYHTLDKIQSLYIYMLQISNSIPPILIKDIMDRVNIMTKLTAFKQEKTLAMWRYILEDGIQKGEIRPLDVEFVSNFLLYSPTILTKQDYFTDESKRLKILKNLFDFMKYGLLGYEEKYESGGKREGTVNAAECSDEGRESRQKL